MYLFRCEKNINWEIWEGGGMDVVFRLIDPEDELAEFLFQCDEFFDEDEALNINDETEKPLAKYMKIK